MANIIMCQPRGSALYKRLLLLLSLHVSQIPFILKGKALGHYPELQAA